jgi:nucleoid-associated protein YgaU
MGKTLKFVLLAFVVSGFIFACARAPIEEFADAKAALDAARQVGADSCAKREFMEAEKAYKDAENLLKNSKVCSPNPITTSAARYPEPAKGPETEETECIPQDELYKQVRAKLVYAQGKAEEAKNIAGNAGRLCEGLRGRLSEINDEILSIKEDLVNAGRVRELNMLMQKYNEVEGYLTGCDCREGQSAMNELIAMLNRVKESLAVAVVEKPTTEKTKSYTVKRGDCLWRISEKEYLNPFMWPLIYWSNKGQIKDPDLIFPGQVFKINQNYSAQDKNKAIRHAQTRGPWSLFDGK